MVVVLAAIAVIDVALSIVGGLGSTGVSPGSGGPSSSFNTAPTGMRAWAQLLAHYGRQVVRVTAPLSRTSLPSSSTLVVADATSWPPAETVALASALRSGDRVVLAGVPPNGMLLPSLLGAGAPRWSPIGVTRAFATSDAPEVAGVHVVAAGTGAVGTWDPPGTPAPLLVGAGRVLASATEVGPGRLVLLADAAPLQNARLAAVDNAAFGIDIVGSSHSVVFDEYAHGFGTGGGLGALPSRWKWGLGLAAFAVALWMWSAARRFGPPEAAERPMPPARVQYVDGLATVLAASGARNTLDAVEPVRDAARARLSRGAGVSPDAPDSTIVAAARAAGLPEDVTRDALAVPQSADDVVALGRAHAWLVAAQEPRR